MNKIKFKIIVDWGLAIAFALASVSAFLGRDWREVHEISGEIMIALALMHLILNWKIFVSMTKNLFKIKKAEEISEAEKK
jgi:hypothetical protein